MKETKEYIFKKRNLTFEFILIAALGVMLGFIIFKLITQPLALVLVGAIPGCMLYLQYYVTAISSQFNRYDAGKKILISEDRLTMTFIQDNVSIDLSSTDVEKVEVYEQNCLGKFGTFNYMIIYTNADRKFLITQFTILLLVNDRVLEKFLRQKPRTYFKKTYNYIDKQKFTRYVNSR